MLDTQRKAVLKAALPHVLFDGWTDKLLARATKEAAVKAELALLFPKGARDAVAFHSHLADKNVADILSKQEGFSALPIHIKIRTAILKRLELAAPDKEAIRKALSLLSMPKNMPLKLKLLHDTCDSMWNLAGDNSTDYNWYTKRMILGGVYSSTLMCWLNDESEDMADTKAFLDRRLSNVKTFGDAKKKLLSSFRGFGQQTKS